MADPEAGEPLDFPANLDDRFRQEQIASSLNAAFEEAGVKGEVLLADCDEYPCIVCSGIGGPALSVDVTALHAQIAKLSGTNAMAGYRDAGRSASSFSAAVKGSDLERLFFCQSFYPRPDKTDDDDAIKKRLRERTIELRHAF